jgi:hypothetical protein
METSDILKKVRKIEIKTRGLSKNIFAGEYHSAFKGRGMTFSEVREYQYGDDIRSIDWNVTARFGHPYIKVFEEERELTVVLLIDVSGEINQKKIGQRLKVMIDRIEGDNFVGRTEFDSPEVDPEVLIPLSVEGIKIGEFYTAEIVDAAEFDLYGR